MRVKKFRILTAILLVTLCVPARLVSDVVIMKDGTVLEGTIVTNVRGALEFVPAGKVEREHYYAREIEMALYGNPFREKENLVLTDGTVLSAYILKERCRYLLIAREKGSPVERIPRNEIREVPGDRERVSETLRVKRKGWYFTGVPLVAYSGENGFRGGGRVYFYRNGNPEEDPYFFTNPYGMRLYLQATASTKEMYEGEVDLDWNNINGSIFGVEANLEVEKMYNGLYFGQGNSTTSRPLTDAFGTTYSKMDNYEDSFLSQSGYGKYNNYQYLKVTFTGDMVIDWGSPWKFRAGYTFQWWDIGDWEKIGSYQTLLNEHKPVGYGGGFVSALRAGISFDTRDYEPDPRKGVLLDMSMDGGTWLLGSTYDFFRLNLEARGYYTFLEVLTLAGRAGYRISTPGTPFFLVHSLGGRESLRGYLANRFAGNAVTLFNLELRYRMLDFLLWGQRFGVQVVLFTDAGNAYSNAGEPFSAPRFTDYRLSYGGGIVGTWNQSTLLHLYVGASGEDIGISLNFGHSF
jgi:hypothetical protein